MSKQTKADLQKQVVMAAREFGISNVLFRNMVGEALGVNVTDMECLGLIFHKGITTPTELAQHTSLSSGATTAMLDRLEKSGLIQRQPNPSDRRGTIIVLAKTGTEKVAPLFKSVREAQNELVASYSEKELQLLLRFFEKFINMWNDERRKLGQKLKTK